MSSQRAALDWSASRAALSRRSVLATTAGVCGDSLSDYLQLQTSAAEPTGTGADKAKACIIIDCWGGRSHLESLDLKPQAPSETRGEFHPIPTVVPGIEISE